MFDSKGLRTIARDLAIKARAAQSNEEKIALTSRAKSYLLLAKNAEWLQSTEEFLKAIEGGKRWPHPTGHRAPPRSEGPPVFDGIPRPFHPYTDGDQRLVRAEAARELIRRDLAAHRQAIAKIQAEDTGVR
jgi:hypothetical protein